MNGVQKIILVVLSMLSSTLMANPSENPLLQKGWAALVKDDENKAFGYFWEAHEKAKKENNSEDKAEALLYLGICSYGSSLEKGLQFATQSLNEFKNLEKTNSEVAKIGRYRCLQLISTIYSRQKKYDDAMRLSKEVVVELKDKNDKSGTLGLAYTSLGTLYDLKKRSDSSDIFYQLALTEFEKSNNTAYLPTSYCKMGEIAQRKKQKDVSLNYFNKALSVAQSSENKQAQVNALIGLGNWYLDFNSDTQKAENYFLKALVLAESLTDRTFEIKSLEALIKVKRQQNDFFEVSQLQNKVIQIKDEFYSFEREQIVKSLEVQFEVAEKNRKLKLVSAEKEVSKLTNYLLISLLGLLLIVFTILFFFLKRINKRDKQLLKTKEELVALMEEQKLLKEQQFQNDIEHKESQLSAITIQMVEKNELLDEIKSILNKKEPSSEAELKKLVNKYTIQDNNWKDFDHYFESVNKNFYTRLKQKYPEISANDLKICALIKLNLSIKEMATILNISPDSVKTARHRLRKKLQLSTEENLTDFILSV
ncbi:tetratricopeptide repeat protein [Flavobacterium sp.]|uniref:tetratricopeptide repeat protein n=1 Tax=Flavobacterium sp. TaxID=239 RepID=UPI002B4AAE66|nr:tetratricopeptide repeat protein [Flavobacterium sp.]HLP64426.1 tetratricopeptide repeat protein [Flavobacterium sp.]